MSIGKSHSQFTVQPWSKPSSLNSVWLSRFSSHPGSVHRAWPLARLKSRLALCSNNHIRREERARFRKLAQSQHLSPIALASIACHDMASTAKPSRPVARATTKWLVLPFFPVLSIAGFVVQANRFWTSKFTGHLLSIYPGVQIRLSWCNALRSVQSLCRYSVRSNSVILGE